ncbi:hypothetical protein BE17_08080 [Sorangium cellulosum]|uniref:Uncharacterized protein n=1 Tax=Sorangium cellulosum TaxID=56 RepID=A0A150SLD1_SORCE|nr:hypothetical protein BE17_08080 [Sorangium cellulosum]
MEGGGAHAARRSRASSPTPAYSHAMEQSPPQSTPVSLPFFVPSRHDGAWHVLLRHTSLEQSAWTAQRAPSPQGFASGPPQSTPVSEPFARPSRVVGAAHLPPVHAPDAQSASSTHVSPFSHSAQGPPQSMSVSLLPRRLSAQLDGTHLWLLHTSVPVVAQSP